MITITGRILENRYTTAQWAAITSILPNNVWGHEVDGSGNPIGSKMGDGINLWANLPYWYQNIPLAFRYKINAGTPIPKNLTIADIPNLSITSIFWLEYNSGLLTNNPVSSQLVQRVFTTSAKTIIASINVYGNDDGTGKFNEDTWLIVK